MEQEMDRIARFFDADNAGFDDDLDLVLAYAQRTGGPVLELGCGTGRLLAPLMDAGLEVTGVDMSAGMLEIARQRLGAPGAKARHSLIAGDYTQMDLRGPYALAVCAMNTFMHLADPAAQVTALRHWRKHLRPGGLLILDLFNPDVAELASLDGHLQLEKSWRDPASGFTVMKQVSRTLDQVRQLVHVTFVYDEIAPDGALHRTLSRFDMRYLWPAEAQLLLASAGYRIGTTYGDWDLSELVDGSPRLIIVAERKS
jgi:SAM-dependent methyltransferase